MRAFGVYVHIPFCVKKCAYCDFNSYPISPAAERGLAGRYVHALLEEIPRARERACRGVKASTLYVGGGTPTVIPARDLAQIVATCCDVFEIDAGAEVTVECNPGTVHYDYLRLLREAGVNRLSIGLQALDDGLLRGLGRIHTAEEALAAVDHARRAGFTNINLDLMFGIPGQTLRLWEATLARAMALEPEHLSIYPLELEDGTPLHRSVSSGEADLPPEDDVLDMWDAALETLAASGYRRYEISNYSRPGYECRHNLTYWRNGEYLGLGAGACSHISRRRYYSARRPLEFCEAVEGGMSPVTEIIPPEGAPDDAALAIEMSETAMMGLRLSGGLYLEDFRDRFGKNLAEAFPGVVERLSGLGLVSESAGSIRLTRRGLFLANAVFREFVPQAVS